VLVWRIGMTDPAGGSMSIHRMRRRTFIAALGGAAAWPLVVRAQQNERIRRIGVLQPFAKDSPDSARVAAFLRELQRLGWTDGRNLQIEYRWETSDLRKAAMRSIPAYAMTIPSPELSNTSSERVTRGLTQNSPHSRPNGRWERVSDSPIHC